jgi:hypothetical protein
MNQSLGIQVKKKDEEAIRLHDDPSKKEGTARYAN